MADFIMVDNPDNKEAKEKSGCQLPGVNFSTFIISLSTSALVSLGEVSEPGSQDSEKDLMVAKHTIDIIGMLHEKTKGNLTKEEESLIQGILSDLRMKYVKELK